MSRKERISSDQTGFVDQAPLWQKTTQKKIDLQATLKQNKNLRPFYMLIALILFLILILAFFSRKTINQIEETQEQSVRQEQLETPLEKRINSLETQLKAADPTRQQLPFPNLNLELSLP